MNELVNQPSAKAQSLATGGPVAGIAPQNIGEAFRLADAIHQSGMAPFGLNTPQKVMIAMLAGMELGLPSMQSVQSVAVINNRPCMWGDALIAVVRHSPLCLYVREWIEGEGDSRIAYCETQRQGEPHPVVRTFSVQDAKDAGLWQTESIVTKKRKDGGQYQAANDSPWFKYKPRMLQMRARAWCLRDVYADVLKGMHAREEIEDYARVEEAPAQPALPPLQERLRLARAEPQEGAQEREGFNRDLVTTETAALSGAPAEAEDEAETDASDDGVIDADPQEEESETEASSDLFPGDAQSEDVADTTIRNLLTKCRDKFLALAQDKKLTVEQRRTSIETAKDAWKAELPADRHDFLKRCVSFADKVTKGGADAADAKRAMEGMI